MHQPDGTATWAPGFQLPADAVFEAVVECLPPGGLVEGIPAPVAGRAGPLPAGPPPRHFPLAWEPGHPVPGAAYRVRAWVRTGEALVLVAGRELTARFGTDGRLPPLELRLEPLVAGTELPAGP